jgi:hypothetical protein
VNRVKVVSSDATSGLSNSMMGGAFGGHVMSSSSTSSSSSFGNKNHDLVYGIIRQNKDEQGINTGHILTQVFLPSGFVSPFFTFPFSDPVPFKYRENRILDPHREKSFIFDY